MDRITMLAEYGVPMPIGKLVDAIAKAYEFGMISRREEHWLRYFNRKAGKASRLALLSISSEQAFLSITSEMALIFCP